VVEDDPLIRRLNSEVLTYSGYQVDAAEDGAAAWETLYASDYDLLVTDNDMPKVSGVELLKKIHATRMDLPTIMATGIMPTWAFATSPWLRPDAVLLKPYTFDELLGTVKEVLRVAADAGGLLAPPPNWQDHSPAGRLRL
jgi:DNA-binding response OmpR family regulator